MTSKQKRGIRGTIDDVLDDLLGEDTDDLPTKNKSPGGGVGGASGVLPSRSGKRSLLDDDFFSKLAEEAEKETEGSDVSEADPKAIVESMKDIDDMDADLFGSKQRKQRAVSTKPSSAPAQRRTSPSGVEKRAAADPGDESGTSYPGREERKSSSAPPPAVRGYRKFSFVDDVCDDLGDLLDGLDPEQPKNVPSGKAELMNLPSPSTPNKEHLASPAPGSKKRDELTFDEDEDDDDDLMDALGFSDVLKDRGSGPALKKEREAPRRPRTRLDEILGIGTSPHLLQRPATGEKNGAARSEEPSESPAKRSAERPSTERQPERSADKLPQRSSSARDASGLVEEDFTFGLYQPTVGSTPEGQQSRRQSVRFSLEDIQFPERRPKPSTQTSTRPSRPASDWLGLKQDEDEEEDGQKHDEKEPAGVLETRRPPPSPPLGRAAELRVRASSAETPLTAASRHEPRKEEEEEEDWLAGALSKTRVQGPGRSEERKEQVHEETDLSSLRSKRNATVTLRGRQEDMSAPSRSTSESLVVSGRQESLTPTPGLNTRAQHTPETRQTAGAVTTGAVTTGAVTTGAVTTGAVQQGVPSSTQPPVTLSADSVQQLLLQQQAQLWGLGASLELGSVQRRDTQQQPGDMTALQARVTHLQEQVRSLQLEKDQIQMLLDSVQQRHRQDRELMENTHRARVQLLEESMSQREAQVRLESQVLAERLAASTRLMEQERAELQELHQRRLTRCQLDRDREVERLRDLQRKSILDMKEDYEEQLRRLQKLKDEEIDAVTSATSQTRSLAAIIEQMEQFSGRLGELACRVENTHENTAQGLERGAQHRGEELRVLQERLSQQQREMAEERTRLKEVIAKMDTQLAEQQRSLQQERWRATAEQAKAESALRGLEEEKRTMTQQFTMEREELERAKSALLAEQQAVMQQCSVERRKLASEWTQFHTQEKLRQERVEREASRALERETHREGSVYSMAQEQAEITLRAGQLKQKEEAVQRDRESLDKLREELQQEKSRLSTVALRLQTRAQEVESFSQLASERYEEGERALQKARQVEAEHQTRLRTIHAEMEQLRKQEHSLQQERMRMTDHHKELERLRHSLPINPFSPSTAPLLTGTNRTAHGAFVSLSPAQPRPFADVSAALASSQLDAPAGTSGSGCTSPELQATLALLRHTAEKDRDFLQDEQFFLETLKKAPYNSTFHTE